MEIRFISRTAQGGDLPEALADHARARLRLCLAPCADRVAHVSVRLGERRARRGRPDTYCVVQVQLRDAPAATAMSIGTDARDVVDRAADRVGPLAVQLLRHAGDAASPFAAGREAAT